MPRVAITGSAGTIGTVLRRNLVGHELVAIDLPELDVRDYESLAAGMRGCDAVVHLAWDMAETSHSRQFHPENNLMTANVYRAAQAVGVRRAIMASSVHADSYEGSSGLLAPRKVPWPDSPYGASKVFMEALGRYYAKQGLEVICIRFGAVNPEDRRPDDDPAEARKWFRHRDCAALVSNCLDAASVPDGFVTVYGVSDNPGRVHDLTNPFGWSPVDGV